MTLLRDQLKARLSGKTPEPGSEPLPSVAELSERIKALKAAHNIEVAPQRVRQKQSTAEEPVTARIRRRTEANAVSDPVIQPDAALGEPEALPPESAQNSPLQPPMSFQQRLATERQRKDPESSLP